MLKTTAALQSVRLTTTDVTLTMAATRVVQMSEALDTLTTLVVVSDSNKVVLFPQFTAIARTRRGSVGSRVVAENLRSLTLFQREAFKKRSFWRKHRH